MSELLDRHGGVATRADLLAVLPVHVVDHAIASGALVLVLPRTYTTPERACDSEIHRRAALRYAGSEAALSHTSGLAAWGMSVPEGNAVHISVDRAAACATRSAWWCTTARVSHATHPPYSCATGSVSFGSKAAWSTAGRYCRHSTGGRRSSAPFKAGVPPRQGS